MAAKKRNYAQEYERRIAKAQREGRDITSARGHKKEQEKVYRKQAYERKKEITKHVGGPSKLDGLRKLVREIELGPEAQKAAYATIEILLKYTEDLRVVENWINTIAELHDGYQSGEKVGSWEVTSDYIMRQVPELRSLSDMPGVQLSAFWFYH